MATSYLLIISQMILVLAINSAYIAHLLQFC
jgi:hypothetical protein